MSYDFILSTGRDDENEHRVVWMSGPSRWVIEQIRASVTDEHLKHEIHEFQESGHSLFSLSLFTEPQIEQMTAVILGPLLSAARREWPPGSDPYNMTGAIEEFVTETRDWLAAINAQRRAEGWPELQPSLG